MKRQNFSQKGFCIFLHAYIYIKTTDLMFEKRTMQTYNYLTCLYLFQNLKDPDILKKHIDVVRNLVCSQGYTYKTRLDEVTSKMLKNHLTATL